MVIGVDFDGTVVRHKFPEIGEEVPGAVQVLRECVRQGHKLVLFTMRSNNEIRSYLQDAIDWFKERNIELYGVQTNPTQHEWTSSPKAYCQLYIDDAALGVPLKRDAADERPYVDWNKVVTLLIEQGVLTTRV